MLAPPLCSVNPPQLTFVVCNYISIVWAWNSCVLSYSTCGIHHYSGDRRPSCFQYTRSSKIHTVPTWRKLWKEVLQFESVSKVWFASELFRMLPVAAMEVRPSPFILMYIVYYTDCSYTKQMWKLWFLPRRGCIAKYIAVDEMWAPAIIVTIGSVHGCLLQFGKRAWPYPAPIFSEHVLVQRTVASASGGGQKLNNLAFRLQRWGAGRVNMSRRLTGERGHIFFLVLGCCKISINTL